MSVSDLFNYDAKKTPQGHQAEMVNDNVLMTMFSHDGRYVQKTYFDFLTGTVAIYINGSNHDRTLTFAEMDPAVLRLHRDVLVELGGRPQPLPGSMDKPQLPQPAGPALKF